MQAYVQAKARIFENQGKGDAVLLNVSDKYTPLYSSMAKSRIYQFGFPREGRGGGKPGCYALGDGIDLLGRKLLKISTLRIPGSHNVENACAAALAASLMGTPDGAIAQTLEQFEGVEHRLEGAGGIDGVRFVNDSKGTNVDSVVKALESFPRPIVLILGGRDKAGDFTRLIPLIREKVTRVVAFGECKAKVASQLSASVTVVEAGSLEETVKGALAVSEKGGTVLFSPGCASYDMFMNYEDRGRQFKALVKNLRESRARETKP
jgi:UDP-N-acetylmuramoylalanine--D-glutamate ligase